MKTPERVALAKEFRIRMLALGTDPSTAVNELLEETAEAIEQGYADFDPSTGTVTYHDDDGRDKQMQFAWQDGQLVVRKPCEWPPKV